MNHRQYLIYSFQPHHATAATAKSRQSCPTLCDPIDGSLSGSPVPGILQARTLEWAAISFSNARKWKEEVKSLTCVWPLATPWTAAYQAPPSMGAFRQEYWSGGAIAFSKTLYSDSTSLKSLSLFYESLGKSTDFSSQISLQVTDYHAARRDHVGEASSPI